MKRATQSDIAKISGVHVTTVSLALRNHPSIPPRTRERILKIAHDLGYAADPALSALITHRISERHSSGKFSPVIGYVTAWPTRDEWKKTEHYAHQQFFQGAKGRAEELGLTFEHFWLKEPGFDSRRWDRLFRTRNIFGLIFAPHPKHLFHTSLDFSRLHAVSIERFMRPHLHSVSPNHFQLSKLAFRQCYKHGYKRVAFACSHTNNTRVNEIFAATFLGLRLGWPKEFATEPFLPQEWGKDAFMKWFEKTKPDCVVTVGPNAYQWLREEGVRIPQDIGFVHLDLPPEFPEMSGINQNHIRSGATAVEMIYSLFHRNELGVPASPQTTLEEGTWVEGKTLKRS